MTAYRHQPHNIKMLKKGFDESREGHAAVFGEKPAESSRGCSWSRQRCLFILLVLGALFLFVYNTTTKAMPPDWHLRWWNGTKWIAPKKHNHSRLFPNTSESSSSESVTSTTVAHMTSPAAAVNSVPPTPLPYKSPGPYLVEYPYKYHFVIDEPKTCEEQKPFVVLLVPVAPFNRAHRDIVRSTWGGDSLVLSKVVKLFFLLGLHAGDGAQQLQEQLLQESREHQDLIQSDFLDCYKNLTIKTMVMLEWLDSRCSSASYAMKIDSDMFLNVPNLVQMLLNAPKKNYMTGLVEREAQVHRDPNSKWSLAPDS
ncbi:uncharacterized protein V6R79_011107 [Siganus canaliculatus]